MLSYKNKYLNLKGGSTINLNENPNDEIPDSKKPSCPICLEPFNNNDDNKPVSLHNIIDIQHYICHGCYKILRENPYADCPTCRRLILNPTKYNYNPVTFSLDSPEPLQSPQVLIDPEDYVIDGIYWYL
jgi:hypothetical protein